MISFSKEQLEHRWDEAPDEIREAVFSDENNGVLDDIGERGGFDRQKEKDLAYICLVAFLGFIPTKDVFGELKELFGENTKQAYDAYVLIDERLFRPIQAQIHAFYRSHRGLEEGGERPNIPDIEPQVNLRKSSPVEAVNLRKEVVEDETPGVDVKNTVPVVASSQASHAGQSAPVSKPVLFNPHNFHLRNENTLKQGTGPQPSPLPVRAQPGPPAAPIQYAQPQPVPMQSQPVPSENKQQPVSSSPAAGPVILHKKEESVPIAQINKYKNYRTVSAGGFLGSFGSIFGKHQEERQAPRVSVEIPRTEEPAQDVSEAGGKQVPITVKNFGDEKQKTIHYSDYKTYIKQRDEE